MNTFNDPILEQGEIWKAQIAAQAAQAQRANVPEPSEAAKIPEPQASEPETANAEPLTEKEAIQIVKSWAADDEDVELSGRRSSEEMVENLRLAAEARGSDVTTAQLTEIVRSYAPNAPAGQKLPPTAVVIEAPVGSYPAELEPLIASGKAYFQDDTWLAKWCSKCGRCETECCGPTAPRPLLQFDGKTLSTFGRQAAGLDPVIPPKPPKSLEQIVEDQKQSWTKQSWWNQFRSVGELEGTGVVKMYIENFLPEGVTIICGLPKEGKSFLALSVVKALTTGKPLFGKLGFEVPEIVPVLYLAAESGDGALKLRCKKFGITEDKTLFIARTLTQGPMFGLNDPNVESVVRAMRPVVVLETLIRFNEGDDEDNASENAKLAEAIFQLIALGARAVIAIHHSRKDLNKDKPTKEAAVRGSGDGLAMVDCVWLVMQDEKLFHGGKGPNQVDVVGWGRDFNPVPMRVALTRKATNLPPGTITFAPGIISCIDGGDFEWVDSRAVQAERQSQSQDLAELVERLVIETPLITRKQLTEATGRSEWEIRDVLKRLGYHRSRVKGGKRNESKWEKRPVKPEMVAT